MTKIVIVVLSCLVTGLAVLSAQEPRVRELDGNFRAPANRD